MSVDLEKSKREQLRWLVMETLNAGRPEAVNEHLMLQTVNEVQGGVTTLDVRRELDYLKDRELVEITERHAPVWMAKLTRHGVDVVEYTVPCDPGIARPQKYW